jgi:hypothetical protein
MKKLLLAALMALGLGMGSAYAAMAPSHSDRPQVIHWGPDYGNDAGDAG